ncbi:MAG: ubiquinone biosynthesis accessory factor UbiJ [Legionellaceae bacterium]
MIKQYSLYALQQAMNHALALDPVTVEKLGAFDNRVLKLIISPLNVSFFMQFKNKKIHLLATYDDTPDTTINSSPLGFIRLSLLPASKVRSLFNDHIRISGDVTLGQAVKQLFDDIDIDWEGHLAHFTGDIVAYQIGSMVRRGLEFKQNLQSSIKNHVSDYLHEELRMFPPREEMNDFFNDVDELSLRVERLTARVNLGRVKHEKN